jgi:hypothetical protein
MEITNKGVVFESYRSVNPSEGYSCFTDEDGAKLLIKTTTLVKMYEIVKYDLERRNGWAGLMATLEEER